MAARAPSLLLALGAAGAAKALGVSERMLRQRYLEWEIPFVRLNGRIVFPVEGLRTWLEARSERGAA